LLILRDLQKRLPRRAFVCGFKKHIQCMDWSGDEALVGQLFPNGIAEEEEEEKKLSPPSAPILHVIWSFVGTWWRRGRSLLSFAADEIV